MCCGLNGHFDPHRRNQNCCSRHASWRLIYYTNAFSAIESLITASLIWLGHTAASGKGMKRKGKERKKIHVNCSFVPTFEPWLATPLDNHHTAWSNADTMPMHNICSKTTGNFAENFTRKGPSSLFSATWVCQNLKLCHCLYDTKTNIYKQSTALVQNRNK